MNPLESDTAGEESRTARAQGALGTVLGLAGLLASLVPLLAATAETFGAVAPGRFLGAGLSLGTVAVALVGWGRLSPVTVGALALVAFSGLVWGSALLGTPGARSMVLLGRGPDLWAPVTALLAFLPPVVLACRWLTPRLWILPALLPLTMGSGFYLALGRSPPLVERLQGLEELSFLPAPHGQPAWISIGFLFPVLGLLLLPGSLIRCLRGPRSLGILGLAGAGFLLIPAACGTWLLHRSMLPNPLTPLLGRLPVAGSVEVTYRSPWDRAPRGDLDHTIGIRTRGYNPVSPRTVELTALVRPPADGESPTKVLLAFRPTGGGPPPPSLALDDLVLIEDGEPQSLTSVEAVTAGSREALLIVGGIPGERFRSLSETTCKALARGLAPVIPYTTFKTFVRSGRREGKITSWDVRDEEHLVKALDGIRAGTDPPTPGDLMKEVLDLVGSMGLQAPNVYVMLVFETLYVEDAPGPASGPTAGSSPAPAASPAPSPAPGSPSGPSGAPDPATLDPEADLTAALVRARTPVFLVGGGASPTLDRFARVSGGFHVPGSTAGDWSDGLGRIRTVLGHDFVLTYQRQRHPPAALEIVAPIEGATVEGTMALEVRPLSGEPYRVRILLGDEEVTTLEHPPWTTTFGLEPFPGGPYVLAVRSLGANGESVETTRRVTIRHPPPVLRVEGLSVGDVLHRPKSVTLASRGRAVTSVTARLGGREVLTAATMPGGGLGLAIDPADLEDGQHVLEVTALSEAGEKIETSVTFRVELPRLAIEVLRPRPGEKVFGQVPVQVEPRPAAGAPPATAMTVTLTGGTLTGSPVGQVDRPPWLVPLRAGDLPPGAYTLEISMESEDGTRGTTRVPVEVIRPKFAVTLLEPKSGATLVEPAELNIAVTDEAALGLDSVEFRAGDRVLEKRIQAPWTTRFEPASFQEGLVRIEVNAVRKDDVTATATASVLVRHRTSLTFHATGLKGADPVPPSLLLAHAPRVLIDGQPALSARFLAAGSLPLAMVIAYPTSRFTADAGLLVPILRALAHHLGQRRLAPGLLGYSRWPVVGVKPGEPIRSPEEVLRVPHPEEGRALYDALARAVDILNESSARRRVLVLLVDGPDLGTGGRGGQSDIAAGDALKRILAGRVELHVLATGPQMKAVPKLEDLLARVARATGGSHAHLQGTAELVAGLESIRRRVESHVVIEVTPKVGQLDGPDPKIAVDVPDLSGVLIQHRVDIP